MCDDASILCGLVPILATPFASDGSLDRDDLRALVAFQLACGVDGVGVLGYASEAASLDESERQAVIETVAAELDGRVPLVVGIGWGSKKAIADQAAAAAAAGAAMLMVLPPKNADTAEVVDFYREAAQASPLPLMIQDAPQLTGTIITAQALDALCDLDNVAAIKIEAQPTPLNVSEAVAISAGRIATFGGQNALFVLEELERGAVGTMPGCEFSDGLRNVLELYAEGAKPAARKAFNSLLPLIRYGLQPGLAWAVHKEALRLGGVIKTSFVRPPALPLDPMSAQGLREILSDLTDANLAILNWAAS